MVPSTLPVFPPFSDSFLQIQILNIYNRYITVWFHNLLTLCPFLIRVHSGMHARYSWLTNHLQNFLNRNRKNINVLTTQTRNRRQYVDYTIPKMYQESNVKFLLYRLSFFSLNSNLCVTTRVLMLSLIRNCYDTSLHGIHT